MRKRLYPIDKEALIAKVLLWIAIFILMAPVILLVILDSRSILGGVFLGVFSAFFVLFIAGGSMFSLQLFLLFSYRCKTHENSFFLFSLLMLAGQFLSILSLGRLPYLWFCCGLAIQFLLQLVWLLCRWVKLPKWLLYGLNAIPGILFIIGIVFDNCFDLLWPVYISYTLYSAACVVIIPKIIHMQIVDLYWIKL